MCLPTETDQSSSASTPGARSMLGIGGLMLLACLGGPFVAGALGGLGAGVLLGAGGVVFALALCAAVPAIVLAIRRRSARRQPSPHRNADGHRRGEPERPLVVAAGARSV